MPATRFRRRLLIETDSSTPSGRDEVVGAAELQRGWSLPTGQDLGRGRAGCCWSSSVTPGSGESWAHVRFTTGCNDSQWLYLLEREATRDGNRESTVMRGLVGRADASRRSHRESLSFVL